MANKLTEKHLYEITVRFDGENTRDGFSVSAGNITDALWAGGYVLNHVYNMPDAEITNIERSVRYYTLEAPRYGDPQKGSEEG